MLAIAIGTKTAEKMITLLNDGTMPDVNPEIEVPYFLMVDGKPNTVVSQYEIIQLHQNSPHTRIFGHNPISIWHD